MKEIILNELKLIEKQHNIKIIYACEAGSRVWGFSSPNSDYDVRFIYVHPINWYLSLGERTTTIDKQINKMLDINGWDLKKVLLLLRKSNSNLLEWLSSPIVYIEDSQMKKIYPLIKNYYLPVANYYHYLNMSLNAYNEYLSGPQVKLKKYLYCLRSLLAVKWIEQDLGVVPVKFEELIKKTITDPILIEEIQKLIDRKRLGEELALGEPIQAISEFIKKELIYYENLDFRAKNTEHQKCDLDFIFRDIIQTLDDSILDTEDVFYEASKKFSW